MSGSGSMRDVVVWLGFPRAGGDRPDRRVGAVKMARYESGPDRLYPSAPFSLWMPLLFLSVGSHGASTDLIE